LFVAMMLVVSALTLLGLYVAQHRAARDVQEDLRRDFQLELAALHRLQDLRNAAVADRSTALARNARIHAALEDNALDLLYPNAQEELRDLMRDEGGADALHARFYRFLDGHGAVIPPPTDDAGQLLPNEEKQLAQPSLSPRMQTGYLLREDERIGTTVDEMIAVPIQSTETGEVISALVLGFPPVETAGHRSGAGMMSGILVQNKLQLSGFDAATGQRIAQEVAKITNHGAGQPRSFSLAIAGTPHLLFFKRLNPQSQYPPAYEVCLYPLTQLRARQRHLRTQFLGAGAILLLVGFLASHLLSHRLSQPVETLAVASEKNRAQAREAEAKLVTTNAELQRSARFSADASHQLKSPITVLRAGLDSLLAREGLPTDSYEEISSLIHQTYRLTGVVEDLLLLSRMDAGKLRLNLHKVDLAHLVAEWVEDICALPESSDLKVESDLPECLWIAGDRKYTGLVVQNLLENAQKYNYRDGTIRITGRARDASVELRVANTGPGIPIAVQPEIFERFQRGGAEEVAGHGLGLNLARELLRLHGGELSLVRSDAAWTEFLAVFGLAKAEEVVR
jgi:signal transduction histidine kinase